MCAVLNGYSQKSQEINEERMIKLQCYLKILLIKHVNVMQDVNFPPR
jgi:hypothetical protein